MAAKWIWISHEQKAFWQQDQHLAVVTNLKCGAASQTYCPAWALPVLIFFQSFLCSHRIVSATPILAEIYFKELIYCSFV